MDPPPDSYQFSFFSGPQPTLTLYTERRGMSVYTAASREAFRSRLLDDNLTYAVSLR